MMKNSTFYRNCEENAHSEIVNCTTEIVNENLQKLHTLINQLITIFKHLPNNRSAAYKVINFKTALDFVLSEF